MIQDAPLPLLVAFLRRSGHCLRRPRFRLLIGGLVIAAAMAAHLLLPQHVRFTVALLVVGIPVAVLAVAGRPLPTEIAAHFTPAHPNTLEGVVRLAGLAVVLLTLPVLPGSHPVLFVVLSVLLLRIAAAAGTAFWLRDREMGWARDAAVDAGMDGSAMECLWLRLSSHRARGARLHAVGLRRAARELTEEDPGEIRVFRPAEWLRGRAAGRNWVLLDRRWLVPALAGMLRVTSGGLTARLELLPGQTVEDVRRLQSQLAAVFEVPEVIVSPWMPGPRGEIVEVEFRLRDPLEHPTPYPLDAEPTVSAVPFGVTDRGVPWTVPMLESSLLLGGLPGSGKSVALHVLLAGLAGLENVAIIGVDPKRGAELGVWAPRLTALSSGDDLEDLLAALVAEMNRRLDVLAEVGEPKVTAIDLETFPLIVLVLDELAELLAGGITRDERARDGRVASLLRLLVAKGRAAAVVPLIATQKPASDTIPTAIRDLIRDRVAFATSTIEMTETIVGSGSAKRTPAHEIRHDLPGVCFLLAEDDREPVRARAYRLDREQARQIADATAELRVGIPGIGDGFRVGAERSIE